MKKITPLQSLTFLITLFCAVNFGFGQIITFDFNGLAGNEISAISNSNDPNLSSSTITRGSGLTGAINDDRFNAVNWNTISIASAVIDNDYMEFIVNPNSGYQFDISTIIFNIQRSPSGLSGIALRSSIDGYSTNINDIRLIDDNDETTEVITFTVNQTNSATAVTYRIYGYAEAGAGNGGFEGTGNDIIVNGSVNALSACSGTPVTYNSGWSATPDLTTPVTIESSFDTGVIGSFQACSLTVNSGVILNVDDDTFIEVQNDVIIDGELTVQTNANFVQYGNYFTVNVGGNTYVNKTSAEKQDWYYYTYWSSPIVDEAIEDAFPFTPTDRRFWFDAASYNDRGLGDNIDLEGDDWKISAGTDIMEPGRGYASTSYPLFFPFFYPSDQIATFTGAFNNGDIPFGIIYNASNPFSFNLIGNPYPSAIDFNAFYAANSSVVDGVAYFWSQSTPPSNANPGNSVYNFSQNDYATYTVGSGGAAGASTIEPTQYVPSGQGFFVVGLDNQDITFTNGMRMADETSNIMFFKTSFSKGNRSNLDNKLWVNLTSDNGVFNQILVSYVDGATASNDGLSFDAPRNITPGFASILYTTINNSDKKYVIQGKAPNNLNADESISLGFDTNISESTIYTLSVAKSQGAFLSNNPVYLKDNLNNTLHDLSASDYTFTSEVGEFTERFEIVFNAAALSTHDVTLNSKSLRIIELEDDKVQFTASDNLIIKTVTVFDLLGRQLYSFKGNSASETYKLSNLSSTVYIAKIELSNGATITKKAIKK